jgi:hypothetical protein
MLTTMTRAYSSSDCVLPPMNHKHDNYIHGGENRSGPFGHDFLFYLLFVPPKKWGRV